MSAAFKNLQQEDDFTARYAGLLEHYGMIGTRNDRGLGQEYGSVEPSHRHLKEAIDQASMLRGRRHFADRAAYDDLVREVVMRRNCRNAAGFRVGREHLRDLPERRTSDFVEEEARVTGCGTTTVRAILWSAPSRQIGPGCGYDSIATGSTAICPVYWCTASTRLARALRPRPRLPALHRKSQT